MNIFEQVCPKTNYSSDAYQHTSKQLPSEVELITEYNHLTDSKMLRNLFRHYVSS